MKLKFLLLSLLGYFGLSAQTNLYQHWDKRFGGNYNDLLQAFVITSDGGYVLGGWSYSEISGDKSQLNWDTFYQTYDIWLVRTDSAGNKVWDKRFGGTGLDDLAGLAQTADGGFILSASISSGASGNISQPALDTILSPKDYWLVKLDPTGNIQWEKRYGGLGADVCADIKQTVDGGYLVGGYSFSAASGDKSSNNWGNNEYSDFWVIRLDSAGNKLWDKSYGGNGHDMLTVIELTADNGYILGGNSTSGVSGDKSQPSLDNGIYSDIWIVKIDSAGNKLWDKTFGGTSTDNLNAILVTTAGYVLGGGSKSGIGGDKTEPAWGGSSDYWILTLDDTGHKIWDKRYGGYDNDIAFSVTLGRNNRFIVAGISNSHSGGDKTENNLGTGQPWFFLIDSTGIILWDKTIQFPDGGSYAYYFTAAAPNDSCYTVASYVSGNSGGNCSLPNKNPTILTNDYWFTKLCEFEPTVSNIQSFSYDQYLKIFPNPTSGNATVNCKACNEGCETIIRDVYGRIVTTTNTHSEGTVLCLKGLSPGVYYVQVIANGYNQVTKPLIIE